MAGRDEVKQGKLTQTQTAATEQLDNGVRVKRVIRDMSIRLYLPETRFAVASIPLEQYGEVVSCLSEINGFVSLVRDKEEITLIVAEDVWEKFAPRFPLARTQAQRRMIRFDTVLDFSVVGFISEISGALADADISILSLSTYSTDAVLVDESRFDDAVSAVKQALVTLRFTHLAQH
jgi:uncharacterized protein